VAPASAGFFDPTAAVLDFLRELAHRGCPCYPRHAWRCALELADQRDTMRQVKARNDVLWPNPHPVTTLYAQDDNDPNKLVFLGLAVRTSDPSREIEAAYRAREDAGDALYRARHSEERSAYSREYRRKNREKFLSWQRDYRCANAERLNAARRARRRAAA
jgi:hypothetical protein